MSHFFLSNKPHLNSDDNVKQFDLVDDLFVELKSDSLNNYNFFDNDSFFVCWQGEIWSALNSSEHISPSDIVDFFYKHKKSLNKVLSGNYALFIHDKKSKAAFIYTDKYNTVPVFYSYEKSFIVGTEYESILPYIESKILNGNALAEYFLFDSTFSCNTLLQNIEKMQAYSCLEILPNNNFQVISHPIDSN